jgi:hypothetical protein
LNSASKAKVLAHEFVPRRERLWYVKQKPTGLMKTLLTISSLCVAAVFLAGGVVLTTELRANRDLRATNQKLDADLRAAEEQSANLRAENQEATQQLLAAQRTSEDLTTQLADLQNADDLEINSEAVVPTVNPYPVQAYLGQKFLGQAWIIPRNIRKDAKTQSYVYEPVVWLDENLRKGFVTHHTNVVEREVESRTYVNTIQYPQPVYYISRPYYHRPPTNLIPPKPSLPVAPPAQPNPPQFNPGNGTLITQKLWTPAGQIKTRPQVLSKPVNSPR